MENKKRGMIIADDIEMNRFVIKKMFMNQFNVYEAENGLEVFDILEEKEVDVVLLDIIMPKMDGLEALSRIRQDERFKNIAVLVATSTKEKTERKALNMGADDIVSKPYDPVVINKRVFNILEKNRLKKILDGILSAEDQSYKALISNLFTKEIEGSMGKYEVWSENIIKHLDDKQKIEIYIQNIGNELKRLKECVENMD